MIASLIFSLFAFVLIFSALMVITAKNPVHAVLFLVLAFFNASGLFVMQGAEFLGLILAIVYVGAVAVLFLFVVMMLDIDFALLRKDAMKYVPLGLVMGAVLLAEFLTLLMGWANVSAPVATPLIEGKTNTDAIGLVLYTQYLVPFQLAGLILFVAMIGAIVLTHRRRAGVRRQNIKSQVTRDRNEVVKLVKVESGKGVEI